MNTQSILDLKQEHGPKKVKSVLSKRFSPIVYDSTPVPQADLERMMEAAKWAPSHANTQTWHFYVANKGTAGFDKIVSTLAGYNSEWAKEAPLLMIACYTTIPQADDKYGQNEYAPYNLGVAVQSMLVEALEMDYYARQMGGFDKKQIQEILNIPENIHPWVAVAIGKIGDYEKATEAAITRESAPRTRKDEIYEVLA